MKKCQKCQGKPVVGSCHICEEFCCGKCLEPLKERICHCKTIKFCLHCSIELKNEFKKCASPCNHIFYGDLSVQTKCQCCVTKEEAIFVQKAKQNLCPLEFEQTENGLIVSGKTFPIKEYLKKKGFHWNPETKSWSISQNDNPNLQEEIIHAFFAQ